MSLILSKIRERALLMDGAMGSMLQAGGMKPGDCPEELNVTKPDVVKGVHAAYAEAGADVLTTNTFGGTRIKLAEYGFESRVKELNEAGVRLAREAADASGREMFVAGGLGPTGRFLKPVGDMDFDEAYSIFYEQSEALAKAGADTIIIETMSDIKEARAAVIAAKEASGLPVIVTMTFQQDLRTLMGTPPDVALEVLSSAGADIVGANCSLGPDGLYEVAKVMSKTARVPLIMQPNAGLPELIDGKTVYPGTPDELAGYAAKFLKLGAGIVGSCCGSTPAHTKAISAEVKRHGKPVPPKGGPVTRLCSRTASVELGGMSMPVIIGERINPTGRKDLTEELSSGKTAIVKKDAKGQAEAGAALIDVNVGLAGADESSLMPMVIRAVEESAPCPIVIDSTDPAAIEAGLKECSGKPLVNSVTGDKDRLDAILPLVKRFGACVLGLTIDEEGVPQSAGKRMEIAERILAACREYGIPDHDLVIDPLVLTASAEQPQASETLKAVGLVREKMGLATSLGVSNISFGLPDRPLINRTYLTMALGYGLDAAMVNPYDTAMGDAISSSAVLTGRDLRSEKYIEAIRLKKASKDIKEESEFIKEEMHKGDAFCRYINISDISKQIKGGYRYFYIKIPSSEDFYGQIQDYLYDCDKIKYEVVKPIVHDFNAEITYSEIEKAIVEGASEIESHFYVKLEHLRKQDEYTVKIEFTGESVRDKLHKAVIDGNKEDITSLIETALALGMAPLEVGNECLIPALTEVGALYEKKEFFLPQVMQAAETMKAAFTRLKQDMKPGASSGAGTVVLATVYGDVHDIGKNILSTLLENHGLNVIDLGKNVPGDDILDKAAEVEADVIGLSALMTTTMTQMEEVIRERDARGMSVPVVIGGAVVTEKYAEKIGAAGSSRDAMEAVAIIKKIIAGK